MCRPRHRARPDWRYCPRTRRSVVSTAHCRHLRIIHDSVVTDARGHNQVVMTARRSTHLHAAGRQHVAAKVLCPTSPRNCSKRGASREYTRRGVSAVSALSSPRISSCFGARRMRFGPSKKSLSRHRGSARPARLRVSVLIKRFLAPRHGLL